MMSREEFYPAILIMFYSHELCVTLSFAGYLFFQAFMARLTRTYCCSVLQICFSSVLCFSDTVEAQYAQVNLSYRDLVVDCPQARDFEEFHLHV
jgi:hypothetical protein